MGNLGKLGKMAAFASFGRRWRPNRGADDRADGTYREHGAGRPDDRHGAWPDVRAAGTTLKQMKAVASHELLPQEPGPLLRSTRSP